MEYIPYTHNSPVKQWIKRKDFTSEDARRVFASMVMFEGCIGFYNKSFPKQKYKSGACVLKTRESFTLHQVFADLAYYGWEIRPLQFYLLFTEKGDNRWGLRFTTKYGAAYTKNKNMFADIFTYSPTYITGSSVSTQPTLGFLRKCPLFVKQTAFRLGMDAEGSAKIGFITEGKPHIRFAVTPRLSFAQTNRAILCDLLRLTKEIGFKRWVIERRNNSWSGYEGIKTGIIGNIAHFEQMGGFVTPVKVKGDIGPPRSVYNNAGHTKQAILLSILHYLKTCPRAKRCRTTNIAQYWRNYYWRTFCGIRENYKGKISCEPV